MPIIPIRFRIAASRALLLACSAAMIAATPATRFVPTTDPAFDQALRAINAKGLAIKDLTADFVQEKHSPLVRKPLVSRGTVTAKGDTSLWVTTAPEPTQMTCDPRLLRLFYPDRNV